MDAGAADALVVGNIDRLSRSLPDFASLIERAKMNDWAVVTLDEGINTSELSGELLANVLVSFAQFERQLNSRRTRNALAMKISRGEKLGRPREVSTDAIIRINELHRDGYCIAEIATMLNEEGVATPRGGRWHSPGVKRVTTWLDDQSDEASRYCS
jgi:DNA invertase Pin-like site-specific DNA recombinase